MKKNEIVNLIELQEYQSLLNYSPQDLLDGTYKNKLFIEYLLENGLHSDQMDNYVRYNYSLCKLYIKYHIFNPLLKCSLSNLLKVYDANNLIIDLLLDNLMWQDKINLYHNFKCESYMEYHRQEEKIISIYLRHGIILPTIFIKSNIEREKYYLQDKTFKQIIDEFIETFKKDHDNEIIEYLVNLFNLMFNNNSINAIDNIKKLIEYKKSNPKFHLIFSLNQMDEQYDKNKGLLSINRYNYSLFYHEVSHFLYESIEGDDENVLMQYELLRKEVDTPDVISKIKVYLINFHQEYEKQKVLYDKNYYNDVIKKYGSLENYIKIIYQDIIESKPITIDIWDHKTNARMCYYTDDTNIREIVEEIINQGKETYVRSYLHHQFQEELMLENMMDAMLYGKIFNEDLEIPCLSGHDTISFLRIDNLSFNESLADYNALLNGKKDLINVLREIVGDKIPNFFDEYIKSKRHSYGNR